MNSLMSLSWVRDRTKLIEIILQPFITGFFLFLLPLFYTLTQFSNVLNKPQVCRFVNSNIRLLMKLNRHYSLTSIADYRREQGLLTQNT